MIDVVWRYRNSAGGAIGGCVDKHGCLTSGGRSCGSPSGALHREQEVNSAPVVIAVPNVDLRGAARLYREASPGAQRYA